MTEWKKRDGLLSDRISPLVIKKETQSVWRLDLFPVSSLKTQEGVIEFLPSQIRLVFQDVNGTFGSSTFETNLCLYDMKVKNFILCQIKKAK